MLPNNNSLQLLPITEILDLAKFVVVENFKHHQKGEFDEQLNIDIHSIYKEELHFFKNAKTFISKNIEGVIEGAIRVLKWNYFDLLPFEKIFGISPTEIIKNSINKPIWHIGRFAIKKGGNDINLFKTLMVCAIAPICNDKNAVALAECDSRLLKVLRILGIKATVVGDSVNYLGSETVPVCFFYDGLIDFYTKNKHIVSESVLQKTDELDRLPKSVVLEVA
ncbi:hypothetical protein [Tenacibaculum sp. 190524A02b]|uniref:Uncharacterized protein n=1 Tax=Tenacibaculum vairaonense TaxID=3137860 RepID=A0ABM9PJZ3_9FLAO